MKAFIKYLFTSIEAEPGILSTLRIIVFIIALTGCGIAIYLVIRRGATLIESGMVVSIITAALGAKIWQANIERKTIDESKLDV